MLPCTYFQMTLITSVKEVREVIHTVVQVANERGNGSQRRSPQIDEVDGNIEHNSNRSNDPRVFASDSLAVEIYKHHMKCVKTEAKNRRREDVVTLNHLAVKVDQTLFPNTLKMKVNTNT